MDRLQAYELYLEALRLQGSICDVYLASSRMYHKHPTLATRAGERAKRRYKRYFSILEEESTGYPLP